MARIAMTIHVEPTEMNTATGIGKSLWYQAGELDIYVDGAVTTARKPAVHNLAMQIAIGSGLRAIDLRCVKCQRAEQRRKEVKSLRLQGF